jgi:hypothetical protein
MSAAFTTVADTIKEAKANPEEAHLLLIRQRYLAAHPAIY